MTNSEKPDKTKNEKLNRIQENKEPKLATAAVLNMVEITLSAGKKTKKK